MTIKEIINEYMRRCNDVGSRGDIISASMFVIHALELKIKHGVTIMTDWIEWHGGECPIKSDKTRYEARLRKGDVICGYIVDDWSVDGHDPCDIIAYRIIEDHETKRYTPIPNPYTLDQRAELGAQIGAKLGEIAMQKTVEPMTREQITAQIEALQKQLDELPEKQRIWVENSRIWPLSGPSTATHYFDIETINGVPHIHGIAMKECGK